MAKCRETSLPERERERERELKIKILGEEVSLTPTAKVGE